MVQSGEQLFKIEGNCSACHGEDATGTRGVGADLTGDDWWHSDGSYEAIVCTITSGVSSENARNAYGAMMQRYYGWCASRVRGMRRKANKGDEPQPLVTVDPQPEAQPDIPVHWRSPSVLGEPARLTTAGCHLPAENVHWRSPSVLGEPARLTTAGCHLPAENAILLSHSLSVGLNKHRLRTPYHYDPYRDSAMMTTSRTVWLSETSTAMDSQRSRPPTPTARTSSTSIVPHPDNDGSRSDTRFDQLLRPLGSRPTGA
jgi:hypothetical protein